jgi:NAD(P)H-dependent flavin oxidoreductase YrpB (nitropropane dioxygenase family)
MAPRIKTSLTELLGIETPVMLAGMGGISGKELVAAVSNAGGFGCWGSAISVKNKEPVLCVSLGETMRLPHAVALGSNGLGVQAELKAEIEEIRTLCNGKPFGIDILVHGHDGGVMHQLIDIFADGTPCTFLSGRMYCRGHHVSRRRR